MKKMSIIGHYGHGYKCLDGQTVKTKIVTDELKRVFGDDEVKCFDTHGGKKTIFKAPFCAISALKKSNNVIIFPAHNGVRVFGRLLPFFRKFFKKRKIHYVVIGGWLPEFLKTRNGLKKALMKFDGIYVETNTMKNALEEQGFSNVFVMPNCKELKILSEDELVYVDSIPYKLCTFSRVMQEKGIEDAVNAVKAVNDKLGSVTYTLDIYGPIDINQTEWFDALKSTFPEYVRYLGCVDSDKSVGVLKNYFALLFPTRFYTEGIPGTIIDAYAAGIPVVSARWESFDDIIVDSATGFGYAFCNVEAMENVLFELLKKKTEINTIKNNCIQSANRFLPEVATKILIKNFI